MDFSQTYIKNMNNIVINMIYIMNLEKEEKNGWYLRCRENDK